MTSSYTLVKYTVYASIIVQIITGFLTVNGAFTKLSPKDTILTQTIRIELVVQVIEACFYLWVVMAAMKVQNITPRRYIDWLITTPFMLLTTVFYMEYKVGKTSIVPILKENKRYLAIILLCNLLMLVFGYLGEIGLLPLSISIPIGFAFFAITFGMIYERFAKKSRDGLIIFWVICGIWSLYGVAAFMSVNIKNISYNILDLISKNLYGVFLFWLIKKREKESKLNS